MSARARAQVSALLALLSTAVSVRSAPPPPVPKPDEATGAESAWKPSGFIRGGVFGARAPDLTGGTTDHAWATSSLRLGVEHKGDVWVGEGKVDLRWVFAQDVDDLTFRGLTTASARNRALLSDSNRRVGREALLQSGLHRLNAGRKTDRRHVVVGRQAIGWGQGRLINPMDLITPRGPFLVDEEDVPGADAISYTEFVGSERSLQFVLVPHRAGGERSPARMSSYGADLLGRWQATSGDLEWFVLGGRQLRSSVAGTEFVLTRWDASLRLAYLGRREESPEVHMTPELTHVIVAGASYAFDRGRLPVTVEVLHNSGAIGDDLLPRTMLAYEGLVVLGEAPVSPDDETFFRSNGRLITRAHNLLQMSLGRELDPLQRVDVVGVVDPAGRSGFLGLHYRRSLGDETVWSVSLNLFGNRGSPRGEFAGRGPMAYSFVRHHF